jgi:hypothetical protein
MLFDTKVEVPITVTHLQVSLQYKPRMPYLLNTSMYAQKCVRRSRSQKYPMLPLGAPNIQASLP